APRLRGRLVLDATRHCRDQPTSRLLEGQLPRLIEQRHWIDSSRRKLPGAQTNAQPADSSRQGNGVALASGLHLVTKRLGQPEPTQTAFCQDQAVIGAPHPLAIGYFV